MLTEWALHTITVKVSDLCVISKSLQPFLRQDGPPLPDCIFFVIYGGLLFSL